MENGNFYLNQVVISNWAIFCYKMGINCKLYTNGQWMMLYMLIV